jgi:hypothetical protein
MKDIYVYFSNTEYLKELWGCPDYIHPYDYDLQEYSRCTREEYGKLNLKNGIQLRLLFDSRLETKCPWCSYPQPEVKQESHGSKTRLYAECPDCLARGSILNVNSELLENQQTLDEYKKIVMCRWSVRTPKSFTL